MKTILTIIGARPQFIKAATVSRALTGKAGMKEVLIHTGQHFDDNMSEIFFKELEVPVPSYTLGISGLSHGAMTGRMLERLEELIRQVRPNWVLVYGDTNSTLAGALAAVKLHIPIAHVEAGLRSFNRVMPEELNRVLTDHCADLLFTPTDTATKNLREEGFPTERIRQVGDVMYDAAIYYGHVAEQQSRIISEQSLERGKYVLATIHRQENTDDRLRLVSIMEALRTIGREIKVVLPLHPRTRTRLAEIGPIAKTDGLLLIEPVGYLDMIMLERGAAVIATDSGGVQKEAYFHGIPCVTLRDETEWLELVTLGWNRLAPPGKSDIAKEVLAAVGTQGLDAKPYGNGHASYLISEYLQNK